MKQLELNLSVVLNHYYILNRVQEAPVNYESRGHLRN